MTSASDEIVFGRLAELTDSDNPRAEELREIAELIGETTSRNCVDGPTQTALELLALLQRRFGAANDETKL